MKVTGATGSGSPAPAGGAARPAQAGPAFAPQAAAASGIAPAGAAGAVGSVGALIALQAAAETPLDRRRRATQRAGRILDVLDEMKLGLLEGRMRPEAFARLRRLVGEERAATDHPGMEGVLDEIDVRAAVELAKLEMSRVAA